MKRTRFSREQIESEQLSDPEAAALTDNESAFTFGKSSSTGV